MIEIPFAALETSIDGVEYDSKYYGKFIIIHKQNYSNVTIQFLYDGYIYKTRQDHIKKGDVKNPYHPRIHGTACFGRPSKNKKYHKKIKGTWGQMIDRCYDTKHWAYKYYGDIGTAVDKRWHVYEYFLEDVSKLPGWVNKLENWKEYTLDKDALQDGMDDKIYSLKTCCWVSKKKQVTHSKGQIIFTAISPEGVMHKDMTNLTTFCDKMGINMPKANKRLNNILKYKPGGWDFINKRNKY